MGKVHFIVSQNYDNLHIKSGFPKGEAGQPRLRSVVGVRSGGAAN